MSVLDDYSIANVWRQANCPADLLVSIAKFHLTNSPFHRGTTAWDGFRSLYSAIIEDENGVPYFRIRSIMTVRISYLASLLHILDSFCGFQASVVLCF